MTNRAWELNSESGKWKQLAKIPIAGGGITHCGQAVDPVTGYIYLVGGISLGKGQVWPNAMSTKVTRVYSTKTNKWLKPKEHGIPKLPASRGGGVAAIVGRWLHFYGGGTFESGSDFVSDHAEHWAINLDNVAAGGGWQALAPLSVGRNHLGGTAVGGKLYAMGGQKLHDEYNGNYDVVEEYDPATDTWKKMAPLPKAIGHITPGVFPHAETGGIFVLGGTTNKPDSDALSLVYFSPAENKWTVMASATAFPSQVAGMIGDTIYAQVSNYWYKGKVELK